MITITFDEAIRIVCKAIELSNIEARAQDPTAVEVDFESFDNQRKAMATAGVVRAVEAMQALGFEIKRPECVSGGQQ
jgi:hypothetical protein